MKPRMESGGGALRLCSPGFTRGFIATPLRGAIVWRTPADQATPLIRSGGASRVPLHFGYRLQPRK